MRFIPDQRLVEILQESYQPCPGFQGQCREVATWDPTTGQIPRAFVGALGTIEEVRVVIVTAQPSLPLPEEPILYSELSQDEMLEATCRHTFECLRDCWERRDPIMTFQRRIRYLLDQIFQPNRSLEDQLKQAWITQTFLCTAPGGDGSRIRMPEARECGERYLIRQLDLFGDLPVIVLGRDAQRRLSAIYHRPNVIEAPSPNRRGSRAELELCYRNAALRARRMM